VALGWIQGDILAYITNNFGNLTIGVATTFYVIFTYHLLESTEAQRRQATQPFVTVQWSTSDEPALQKLTAYDSLATIALKRLEEQGVANLAPDMLPKKSDRFLNLDLSNARSATLTWLQLRVTAQTAILGTSYSMSGQIDLDNLSVSRGEHLVITLLDLGSILASAPVYVKVESLVYGSAEPDAPARDFTGEASLEAKGSLVLGPPIPEIGPTLER